MAELIFFSGTMDCGKSTLALQTDHNHASRGRRGVVFTQHDRAGVSVLSSRLGLQADAVEVNTELDFYAFVVAALSRGEHIDYLICDEAQFYQPEHIDQLADVVDTFHIDVFAFGITTDFRTRLFPGSGRLIELADRVEVLQVTSLCWCGRRGTHNARTADGQLVLQGDQVVVGDVGAVAAQVGDVTR
jgi:thymidine kinase